MELTEENYGEVMELKTEPISLKTLPLVEEQLSRLHGSIGDHLFSQQMMMKQATRSG